MRDIFFTEVQINDKFFTRILEGVCEKTIRCCLDKCRSTGRIQNFTVAAGLASGEFQGRFYNDSDVYKTLEGVAYVLSLNKNSNLEKEADDIISQIAAAQMKDGYIQTYFQLKKPDEKWTDMNMHEDYCTGHLIEAGIAYKRATGKTVLYDVGIKAADLMCGLFGSGKAHWVPGHQEIELALVKLSKETGLSKYAELAEFLLNERGRGYGVGYSWDRSDWGAVYCQDHETINDMSDAKGHAVRALYMYCAIADIAALTGNSGYHDATARLWDSVVNRNMYITGGVGSSKHNEGFTQDYDLPNTEAYCETCASAAMVYWNDRLNKIYGDGKYADIIELELYNGVIAGLSQDFERFFYVNPLDSDGGHHRVEWYDCSCCPTQLVRFLPSVGSYIYSALPDGIAVNQYIGSSAAIMVEDCEFKIMLSGNYPYGGDIEIKLEAQAEKRAKLALRIPGWCRWFTAKLNECEVEHNIVKGYLEIETVWSGTACIRLSLDMSAVKCLPPPEVTANTGKAAIMRGPFVYCAEETDNPNFDRLAIYGHAKFTTEWDDNLAGGVNILQAENRDGNIRLVPYFAWDNRAPGRMSVWLPIGEEKK